MLETLERLAWLERRVHKAREALERISKPARLDYKMNYLELEARQEALAAAETLLLLEQERLAVLQRIINVFPAGISESAETPVLARPLPTRSAGKS